MTTLIDFESASKALSALDEISGDALANALATVLARKLGMSKSLPPLPDENDERIPAKFERFFDTIFDVQPERKPLPVEDVIGLVDQAIGAFEDRARMPLEDDEDYEADRRSYLDYADEYREMRKLLVDGKISEAIAAHRHMDTFVRGFLYSDDPRIGLQLSIFLDDKGIV